MKALGNRSSMCVLSACVVWICGCGGSPTQAPPRQVASPSVQTSQAASPATPPAAGSPAAPKPKPKPVEKKSLIPANADPRTVFLVSSIGERMEVTGTSGVLPSDQFDVVAGDFRLDSTRLVVESSKTSAVTQSLVGTGKPKAGFTLPKGFEVVKELGYNDEGYPMRILCLKTGTRLALVPAGSAIIGTDDGPDECKPSLTLQLDNYYMEVLEVTVQDYDKFRDDQRAKKKPVPPSPSNPSAPPQSPALGIAWGIAANYARWSGMELPTEAEFEKASRGPDGLRTPWGNGKALWANRTLTTTGAYPTDSSPYGILDLGGNAMEWCADLYSPTAHADILASSANEIPRNWGGPKKVRDMNLRVVKGTGKDFSSWNRMGKDIGKGHPEVGFRCVLRIPNDPKTSDASRAAP